MPVGCTVVPPTNKHIRAHKRSFLFRLSCRLIGYPRRWRNLITLVSAFAMSASSRLSPVSLRTELRCRPIEMPNHLMDINCGSKELGIHSFPLPVFAVITNCITSICWQRMCFVWYYGGYHLNPFCMRWDVGCHPAGARDAFKIG